MKEVPIPNLPGEALDLDKCRETVASVFEQPEPEKAFDRDLWLDNTKEQLSRHDSVHQ